MKNKYILLLFSLIISSVLLYSCTKDTKQEIVKKPTEDSLKEENQPKKDTFDRGKLLVTYDSIAKLRFKNLVALAKEYEKQALIFAGKPTNNQLQKVQNSWKAVELEWVKSENFHFKTSRGLSLNTAIGRWPVNTSLIENSIKKYEDTETFFNSLGSNKLSLAAMEYMLFGSANEVILKSFQDKKRKGYFTLISSNLKKNAEKLEDEWEKYSPKFMKGTSLSIEDGTSLLANEMIFVTERTMNARIAKPLGLKNDNKPIPEKVESPHAQISADLIISSLETIKDNFNGGKGVGFDDYLKHSRLKTDKIPIEDKINKQLDFCIEKAKQIKKPLKGSLDTETASIKEVYDEIKKLVVLLKNDMSSRLNITVLFSDADGDS